MIKKVLIKNTLGQNQNNTNASNNCIYNKGSAKQTTKDKGKPVVREKLINRFDVNESKVKESPANITKDNDKEKVKKSKLLKNKPLSVSKTTTVLGQSLKRKEQIRPI